MNRLEYLHDAGVSIWLTRCRVSCWTAAPWSAFWARCRRTEAGRLRRPPPTPRAIEAHRPNVRAHAKTIRAWLESNGGRPVGRRPAIADRANAFPTLTQAHSDAPNRMREGEGLAKRLAKRQAPS
jgi:hypothetical protein